MRMVPSPTRWLMLAFAVVAAAFLASMGYSQRSEADIDREASQIVTESLPSIDVLSDARGEVRALRMAIEQYIRDDGGNASPDLRAQIGRAGVRLDETLARYIGPRGGDPAARAVFDSEVRAKLLLLDAAIRRAETKVDAHDAAAAQRVFETEIRPLLVEIGAGIWALVQRTNQDVHRRVMTIVGTRKRSTWLYWSLNLSCLAVALGAALLAGLMARQYARSMEERTSNLDQFAGRVAHDIASPLGTVLLAIDMLQRDPHSPKAADFVLRAQRSARRCQKLLEGLHGFARAGSRLDRDIPTDVAAVLEPMIEDIRADDEQQVEVVVEPFDPVRVACSAGVLTSLFENLLGNAVKYSRGSPMRRITVRVLGGPLAVRCEVADTGPGIALDLQGSIFDPYVRATTTGEPGLGLGLATVKRLCEAHEGTVGVSSNPGAGALFWFELPKRS